MSRSACSVKAFDGHLLALGAALALHPNLVLAVFGIPQTDEIWIRVLGVVVFHVGIHDGSAAASEAAAVLRSTVCARALAFVAQGLAAPALILFGSIDFAGAIWTCLTLEPKKAA